jgi:hypothetical protein
VLRTPKPVPAVSVNKNGGATEIVPPTVFKEMETTDVAVIRVDATVTVDAPFAINVPWSAI